MTISRRQAIALSGSTLAGLSLGVVRPESLHAAAAQGQDDWPDRLVERPLRDGFPAPLPLNADGSAPEHPESAAGPISDPLMWRTQGRQTPEIEFDYRQMQIKVDTRGLATRTGTLHFSDLEQLPSAAMYERSYMHRDVVTHVAVAARPNFVITASRDGQVKFWKKTNAGIEFVKHFRAHLGAVTDMAVSPTGAYLATLGAEDKSVKVFDVATFDMIAQVSTAGYTAALCCWARR